MDRAYAFLTQFNVWLARNVFLFKRREHSLLLRHLRLDPSLSVLDFGCNSGFLSDLVRRRSGCSVFGRDINLVALASARRLYPDVVFSSRLSGSFDRVFLSHVLEHVVDPVATLKEAASVLKEGSRLVVSVPQERIRGELNASQILFRAFKGEFSNTHKRKVSLDDIKRWFSASGLEYCGHDFIRVIPPFSSKSSFPLFDLSLVVSGTK